MGNAVKEVNNRATFTRVTRVKVQFKLEKEIIPRKGGDEKTD